MKNNSTASNRRSNMLLLRRKELLAAKNAAGSYRHLANKLGIRHHSYIANFVTKGLVPTNKDAQKKMGIYQVSEGQKRYSIENEIAKEKGWESISEFLTALRNGKVDLPKKVDWII